VHRTGPSILNTREFTTEVKSN